MSPDGHMHAAPAQTDALALVREVTAAVASTHDVGEVLRRVARLTAQALDVWECDIYEYRPLTRSLVATATWAVTPTPDDEEWLGDTIAVDELVDYRVALETRRPVELHIDDDGLDPGIRAVMERWGEKSWLVVPLVFGGQPIGVLELVEERERRAFGDEEKELATTLAVPAAIAIHNARLFRRSKEYAQRLESSYLETVTALAAAMEAKDQYTAEHADMLAAMAVSVGRRLGLTERELRDLQYASVLHDIGKIGIPGHILNKPDRLTDEEFAIMAEHTIIGERIISRIDYLAPIARAIRAAHERWDGRGYPDQLAAEQIPLASRILFVCDAFHAMTSDRPYRKAMPEEDALEELRRNAGAQFDPGVIDAFLSVWPDLRVAAVDAGAEACTMN